MKTDSLRSNFISREAWFTALLTKFAFIVTFEEFLVLYSKQSFYKCLSICLVPLAGITEENSTVQRGISEF